ncbi:conserved hypothetical protein [Hyella patelloides LEGE 07179]|uniref:DUF1565 domain-containing protein n=1 Tax=Hyella patelloides LEGE 07179 TaxID=945734 RepID=A0A563VTK3_9CYAN|nr:DUF1565 domain-containing protein [Hyella patelloides]VEP14806.1 conserved hypothetical protein [Hyella patelloides LEGE 07179]
MIGDRNKHKYVYGLLISVIVPISSIIPLVTQPSIAQEVRVETTIIYVDSQIGDDNNQGARNTPLKTITQALKIAQDNAVISLAPGDYNETTGESFPLIIRNNVTLKGLTGGQGHSVVIEGNGAFISPTAAEQNVTIAAIRNAGTIAGVTVTNPHGRGHGLWIESASPQVSDSTFSQNGNTGLSVNGNSKPIITNNYFHNNSGNGLLIYGTSQPQVKGNTFDSTGFGVSIVQNAVPLLENNTFKGNRIAVILEGNSQGVLRNNTITTSLESGLVAIANAKVDLGISTQPGNNTFRNNQKLDIQNITDHTISATGTKVNGQVSGKVDFSNNASSPVSTEEVVSNNNESTENNFSRLRNNPLPQKNNNQTVTVSQSQRVESKPPVADGEILPPPPSINNPVSQSQRVESKPPAADGEILSSPTSVDNPASQSEGREYVFSAPEADGGSNTALDSTNSSSELLATSTTTGVKYRVLVEASNNNQQAQVKSLYPEAFSTVYQGKSMLQVGAFGDRSKAETTSRSLADLGLNSHILE